MQPTNEVCPLSKSVQLQFVNWHMAHLLTIMTNTYASDLTMTSTYSTNPHCSMTYWGVLTRYSIYS
ncbi:hypothetical protein LINPERPRIM_LOCUS38572 [Linum perenne]